MRKNADITVFRLDANGNEISRLYITRVSWKQRYREDPNLVGLNPLQEYSVRITPREEIVLGTILAGDWVARGIVEEEIPFEEVIKLQDSFQIRAVVDNLDAVTVKHWRLVGQGRGSYGG